MEWAPWEPEKGGAWTNTRIGRIWCFVSFECFACLIQPYSECNLVIFYPIEGELSSQTDSGRNLHVSRCQTKFEGMDTPRMTPDPE